MHDKTLLLHTESANPGDGVKYPASIYNLPVEGVWNGRII